MFFFPIVNSLEWYVIMYALPTKKIKAKTSCNILNSYTGNITTPIIERPINKLYRLIL